jgi:hypothetical protein
VHLRSFAFALVVLSCVFALPTSAQQGPTAATQNPQAVALATKSVALLSGGGQIADITLTGTATRVAGSDTGSGTVTLKALGTSNSRMDLSLSDGTFSELRTGQSGAPQGQWLAPSGSYNSMATHNCFTDAAWFFPALSILTQLSNPNLIATYVGQETKAGVGVYHLQLSIQSPSDPTGLLEQLSAADVYLSASTYLPVALVFQTHPDNDALTNILVEVDFSNYQSINGVLIPFRVQKSLNGRLFLDITVQSAVLNSGLAQSVFTAQ